MAMWECWSSCVAVGNTSISACCQLLFLRSLCLQGYSAAWWHQILWRSRLHRNHFKEGVL